MVVVVSAVAYVVEIPVVVHLVPSACACTTTVPTRLTSPRRIASTRLWEGMDLPTGVL
jgi:hypothetical protein